jgi:hypothetical protein
VSVYFRKNLSDYIGKEALPQNGYRLGAYTNQRQYSNNSKI